MNKTLLYLNICIHIYSIFFLRETKADIPSIRSCGAGRDSSKQAEAGWRSPTNEPDSHHLHSPIKPATVLFFAFYLFSLFTIH